MFVQASEFLEESGANADRFQQILDLAKMGQTVSFSEAQGVYSGRCYDRVNRNIARNGVLVVTEVDTTAKHGPLSPAEKVLFEGGYGHAAPDFSDHMTKEDLIAAALPLISSFSLLVENPLSVVQTQSKNVTHRTSVFESQSYILSTTVALQDSAIFPIGNGLADGGKVSARKGEVWYACYYFIKK